nr:MAG TPA: hypothetical protein [Caudoviricetes sp.]
MSYSNAATSLSLVIINCFIISSKYYFAYSLRNA